jgi:hypothetical protein
MKKVLLAVAVMAMTSVGFSGNETTRKPDQARIQVSRAVSGLASSLGEMAKVLCANDSSQDQSCAKFYNSSVQGFQAFYSEYTQGGDKAKLVFSQGLSMHTVSINEIINQYEKVAASVKGSRKLIKAARNQFETALDEINDK